jgi:hypothetical protein
MGAKKLSIPRFHMWEITAHYPVVERVFQYGDNATYFDYKVNEKDYSLQVTKTRVAVICGSGLICVTNRPLAVGVINKFPIEYLSVGDSNDLTFDGKKMATVKRVK